MSIQDKRDEQTKISNKRYSSKEIETIFLIRHLEMVKTESP